MSTLNFLPTGEPYVADADRYSRTVVARCGNTGLQLPRIALGLWHNFGDDRPFQTQREIIRRAFDLGIFHFDLANNYGPPFGSAEENFGRILAKDLAKHRHELIISSKAGWDMWEGPNGFGGSRKYLLNSLDESLQRMGLDYVDIFYHHRPDPNTSIEESMMALHDAVKSGKALYAGISSYSAAATQEAAQIMRELGTPLVIHQPSYSMLNRWIEEGEPSLLDVTAEQNMGTIAFTPLAQGLLTNRYLDGIPADSRIGAGKMNKEFFSENILGHVRELNKIAQQRGQTLAQMAIAWILRDQGERTVTTALVGASSVAQLEDSAGALGNLDFSAEELQAIDVHAVDSGINLWWDATQSRA
ncbi:L-glyceraldehyde 3-phosphate reductase [Arcanobacterium pluranimalium]|uniref:aldo/keto reductase n=1 Tax=Arcanobacterium pluranimalium TaxID=108028 RepID=UPI00195DBE2E|nr:aldo/keto reductase [Arcanobacterium pluranimalium]MBM7824750.1 L-glyceraldehyde 3-phosphate reductase [Arcanobacterium pluranimalium]